MKRYKYIYTADDEHLITEYFFNNAEETLKFLEQHTSCDYTQPIYKILGPCPEYPGLFEEDKDEWILIHLESNGQSRWCRDEAINILKNSITATHIINIMTGEIIKKEDLNDYKA